MLIGRLIEIGCWKEFPYAKEGDELVPSLFNLFWLSYPSNMAPLASTVAGALEGRISINQSIPA